MIHGNAVSIGCVAIEEVLWLVAQAGIDKMRVVISPPLRPLEYLTDSTPEWVRERYEAMDGELRGRGGGCFSEVGLSANRSAHYTVDIWIWGCSVVCNTIQGAFTTVNHIH